MSSDLCLKWNNHTSAFNKLLSKIHLEDIYSDGTILCQGKFYPVHRFVLSTCSEYFEEMFRQCVRLNNKHPFIIVKDIHPDQMEALLNYMYKGEVNVPQEMLPELIKAAEAFKIRGLAVPDEEIVPKSSRKRSNVSSQSSVPRKSRKQEESSSNNFKCDDTGSNSHSEVSNHSYEIEKTSSSQIDNLLPGTSKLKVDEIYLNESLPTIKAEPVDPQDPVSIADNTECIDSSVKMEPDPQNFDYGVEDSNFESFNFDPSDENFDAGQSASWDNSQPFEGEDGNADDPAHRNFLSFTMTVQESTKRKHCSLPGCNYATDSTSDMKKHFRTHTGEKPFKCSDCTYSTSNNSNLMTHVRLVHLKEKRYSCPKCPYKAGRLDRIKIHLANKHKDE